MTLDRNASCNHDHRKVSRLAIQDTNDDIIEHLIGSDPDWYILATILPLSMELTSSSTRTKISSLLLRPGIKGDVFGQAHVHEIHSSRPRSAELVRILIHHGANVDYSSGAAPKYAISKCLTTDILETIVQGSGASSVLASSVPFAMRHPQNSRLPILNLLLEQGARGPKVDATLVAAVSEGPSAQPIIDTLLKYGASVDFENGRAIKKACETGNSSILQQLLNKNPNGDYLAEALQDALHDNRTRSD